MVDLFGLTKQSKNWQRTLQSKQQTRTKSSVVISDHGSFLSQKQPTAFSANHYILVPSEKILLKHQTIEGLTMSTVKYLRHGLETSRMMILKLIDDMKDAPLQMPTSNGGNPPLWILGHRKVI
jgi:hypothetical protein